MYIKLYCDYLLLKNNNDITLPTANPPPETKIKMTCSLTVVRYIKDFLICLSIYWTWSWEIIGQSGALIFQIKFTL